MTTKIIKMDIKDTCEHCPYCIFNIDDGDESYSCNSLRNNYSVDFEEDEDGDIAGVVWPPIPKCCPLPNKVMNMPFRTSVRIVQPRIPKRRIKVE